MPINAMVGGGVGESNRPVPFELGPDGADIYTTFEMDLGAGITAWCVTVAMAPPLYLSHC